MQKLTDKMTDGFIYAWIKNDFIYYIGSSSRTKYKADHTHEQLLKSVEDYHRKEGYAKRLTKKEYSWTFFRKNLQFENYGMKKFMKDVHPVMITEPCNMTRRQLLKLETKHIKAAKKIGQAVWNVEWDIIAQFQRY